MAAPTFITVLGTALGTSASSLYTVPAGKVFILKKFVAQNFTAGSINLTVKTSAANSEFCSAMPVAAGTTVSVIAVEGHMFAAGEVIQAFASATVSMRISRLSGILVDTITEPLYTTASLGTALAVTATTLYTVPAGKAFQVTKMSIVNVNAAAQTLTTVKTSAAGTDMVLALSIPGGTGVSLPNVQGQVFNAGEVIQGTAAVVSTLRCSRISGLLISV